MRIVAISDLHGYLPSVMPEGDVLIIAGDVVIDDLQGYWDRQSQTSWMRTNFAGWLEGLNYDSIIGIAGNHDFVLTGQLGRELPWIYLNDESIDIGSILFHGSPWTPAFGGWAFMKPERELPEHWDKIPENVDILITHGPPFGYLDVTSPQWGSKNVGSSSLRWRLDNGFPNLKLHVFGHIHPGRGKLEVDDRIYANVTHVNAKYEPIYYPMIFDI